MSRTAPCLAALNASSSATWRSELVRASLRAGSVERLFEIGLGVRDRLRGAGQLEEVRSRADFGDRAEERKVRLPRRGRRARHAGAVERAVDLDGGDLDVADHALLFLGGVALLCLELC